ncbi:MAG: exodeoxyribonuclease VII large subunit [Pseudomonadota bacterium]
MTSPSQIPPPPTTYQVSELAEIVHALIDDMLPSVWVEGEISNLSRPASGHWYFTLKDASAQLRCAMFKNRNFLVRPAPVNGDQVRVRAKVDFYTGRGDLQLICEALEPAGVGELLAAFERLKKKLVSEGLFDEHLKRPLPEMPRHIGVITSATGAALQDIRATLARRWPLSTLWLAPVAVQGVEAPAAILKALQTLPALAPINVLILARGGGSLEDLWAFNNESVVRAVRACPVPVVTGIGHEIDFTLCDFAADLRAPTPTGAAERASPDIGEWREDLRAQRQGLQQELADQLRQRRQQLAQLGTRLQTLHPGRRLQQRAQLLDDLAERLLHASPLRRAESLRLRLGQLAERLRQNQHRRHERSSAALARFASQLTAYNPSAVLERGYAIAFSPSGEVLRDAAQLPAGSGFSLRLARGQVQAVSQDPQAAPE